MELVAGLLIWRLIAWVVILELGVAGMLAGVEIDSVLMHHSLLNLFDHQVGIDPLDLKLSQNEPDCGQRIGVTGLLCRHVVFQ